MTTMEEELLRMDEELYSLYQRSFTIATLEWLPSVAPNKDSYNSLPHIRGIMRQIDRLLYDEVGCNITLNKSELYVLLCSILLHDIGKCESVHRTPNGPFDHAAESQEIINKNWAKLGLASERVANVIAQVCRFHDCPNVEERKELSSEYYIDQFERIRGRLLGALLLLADHLDNSMSRVVPQYLKNDGNIEKIGRFRRKIIDVRPDKKNRMVRIILDKANISNSKEEDDLHGRKQLHGALQDYLEKGMGKYHGSLGDESILYSIAKNTLINNKEIAIIKDELSIMGMPMKKWLIDCDEHLFEVIEEKRDGEAALSSVYAMEPVINLDYCIEILKGICTLSGGIFAQPFHQYNELVNFIREEKEKTYKVKCAVKRLSLLLKSVENSEFSIYYDENVWRFDCSCVDKLQKRRDAKEYVLNKLIASIRNSVSKEKFLCGE